MGLSNLGWSLMGGGQGCYSTFYNAQNISHHKRLSGTQYIYLLILFVNSTIKVKNQNIIPNVTLNTIAIVLNLGSFTHLSALLVMCEHINQAPLIHLDLGTVCDSSLGPSECSPYRCQSHPSCLTCASD